MTNPETRFWYSRGAGSTCRRCRKRFRGIVTECPECDRPQPISAPPVPVPGVWTVKEAIAVDGFHEYTLLKVCVGDDAEKNPDTPEDLGEIRIRVPATGRGLLTLGTTYAVQLMPGTGAAIIGSCKPIDEVPF